MSLRGPFSVVFFLAIGAHRLGQYGSLLRNLWAVYGAVQTEIGAIQVVLGNLRNICKSRKAA